MIFSSSPLALFLPQKALSSPDWKAPFPTQKEYFPTQLEYLFLSSFTVSLMFSSQVSQGTEVLFVLILYVSAYSFLTTAKDISMI